MNCVELVYDGKIYQPYGIGDSTKVDSVIGYYEECYSENDIVITYVLSYNGQSPDEWLVTAGDDGTGHVNGCNIGVVWKEVNVTNIPDGIEKETDW